MKKGEVAAWLDETIGRFGKIDGAANMAGVTGETFGNTSIENLTDDQWDQVMEVNVRGVFNCLRAKLQRMTGEGGSIVNASSAAGTIGVKNGAPYCASKVGALDDSATWFPLICPSTL